MKSYVMIQKYAFCMFVLSFMVPSLYAQSIIHQGGVVGQVVPSDVPPDPDRTVKRCVMVLMNVPPSPYNEIVPGWGLDENQAYENAESSASRCSNETPIRLPAGSCEDAELPECAITFAMTKMAAPTSSVPPVCFVRGKLMFCDGTIPIQIRVAGATWCEAVQKAYKNLCKIKDPCKRGYVKFCVENH